MTAAAAPSTVRRRRRRWPVVLLVVLLVLVALAVVAYLVADGIVRDRAEAEIERTIAADLPEGVTGRVDATVQGPWALPQLASGEFEHVTLVSRGLRVADAPARATVQLYGLPVDGGPVGQVDADLTVGQSAFRNLAALQDVRASDPVLGRNRVSTTVTQSVLGLDVQVGVVLRPSLVDQIVRLDPVSATITAGPATVPATAIVRQLLPNGISVCAAEYLPEGITVQYLRTERRAVTVGLSAFRIDPARIDASRTGSCG